MSTSNKKHNTSSCQHNNTDDNHSKSGQKPAKPVQTTLIQAMGRSADAAASSTKHSPGSLQEESESLQPLKKQNTRPSPQKEAENVAAAVETGAETEDLECQESQEGDGGSTPKQQNQTSPPGQDNETRAVIQPPVTFKAVNSRSQNQRECKRITGKGLYDHSDKTQKHKNQCYTRATLKLTLNADDEPVKALVKIVKELLNELQDSDNKITLIPWKTSDYNHDPITSTSEVPTTVSKLRKYFERLYLPKPGDSTVLYSGIHIGHTYDFIDFKEDIQIWLNLNNHGLFYNMLQVEDAKEIGWLLYSTREMDAGALADEISEAIGLKIGLRWMTIKTGAKKISESTRTQALIVEVSNEHKWMCQRKLVKLYSRTNKSCNSYPNGIRLRFVKLKKDALNSEEKGKLDKLRNCQLNFLKSIKTSTTYDILQLDYSSEVGVISTLHQMIMSLHSTTKPNTPIFHCVDMDWQEDGFVFQYSPHLAEEAETTLNTLLPLLTHHFPHADVGSNFTNQAEERC